MNKAIEKLAKELNRYDSASLMVYWQEYMQEVIMFEPTKRWEEAALVLCLIQSLHWKNQLFNAEMLASSNLHNQSKHYGTLKDNLVGLGTKAEQPDKGPTDEEPASEVGAGKSSKSCKILHFKPSTPSEL